MRESKLQYLRVTRPTDILVSDPCYVVKKEDWVKSEFGEKGDVPGKLGKIVCGDRSFDITCEGGMELPGIVGVDSGSLGIYKYDEVKSYNPEFSDKCSFIVPSFSGIIIIDQENKKLIFKGNNDYEIS